MERARSGHDRILTRLVADPLGPLSWERDSKRCPLTRCRVIANRSVVLVDDFLHDRQAQASAAAATGGKQLEQSTFHLARNARSVVDDV